MTLRRAVIRRSVARQDIEAAAWYCADEAGTAVAERFVAALEAAFTRVAEQPGAGSSRYAERVHQSGLRFWSVQGFPYLIFYLDRGDWVDVLRVLHESRDIPEQLMIED